EQLPHRARRVCQRGAARTERHADEFRCQRLQFRQRAFELRALFVGLGGKEFEGNRNHRLPASLYLSIKIKRMLAGCNVQNKTAGLRRQLGSPPSERRGNEGGWLL